MFINLSYPFISMEFSVIIPAHNEQNYIEKTLKSLKSQSIKVEIIVVCNSCNDSTAKIAKNYASVYEIKQKGISIARNFGAKKASGSTLIFLDADTCFQDTNALEKVSLKNISLGTCYIKPDSKKLKHKFVYLIKNIFTHIGRVNGITIINKKIFEKISGYNSSTEPTENRNLLKKAKKYAKFKVINTKVISSTRRYDKIGYLRMILYWTKLLFKRKEDYKIVR